MKPLAHSDLIGRTLLTLGKLHPKQSLNKLPPLHWQFGSFLVSVAQLLGENRFRSDLLPLLTSFRWRLYCCLLYYPSHMMYGICMLCRAQSGKQKTQAW